ncbi:MAG: hypothetical protein P0S96_05170 [Simkaniaceae bacterium]|nr:hypothetical protein [Candidatus Sacchlamyda saccharinae]
MLNVLPPEVAAVPVITYFVSAVTASPTITTSVALVTGVVISHFSAEHPLSVRGVFCRKNVEVALLSVATTQVMQGAEPHLPLLNRPELLPILVGGLFFLAGSFAIDSVRGVFPALRGP